MSLAHFAIGVLAVCFAGIGASPQGTVVLPAERPAAQSSSSEQSKPDSYSSWMAGFRTGHLTGALGDHHKIELAVSTVDDDHDSITTLALSTEGTVSMVRYTPGAIQGGGPGKIPEADFKRLTKLMTQLPDDHSWLPPKGRRLVVQVDSRAAIVARVYDRANLPDTVIEIADLLGVDTWPLYSFPRFQPEARWKEPPYSALDTLEKALDPEQQILAISPDERQRATENNPVQSFDTTVRVGNRNAPRRTTQDPGQSATLRIEDYQTGALIHEFREPMIGVYFYSAQFTRDGRFLLAQSTVPDLRIYDTTTWQKIDSLQGIPAGAIAYDPAPDWKHGVVVFPSGEIDLIEADSGRKLAQIDPGDELQSVAYSPDESRVAIVTVNYDPRNDSSGHMRIWDTGTGRMLRELRPLEGTPEDGFGTPIWWPDGKYLFALTREGRFGAAIIGIWNTETGRYRGGLAGCEFAEDPQTEVILEHGMFYSNCRHEFLKWKGDSALEKIVEFERSLTH
jgi:WD40 repeat protein